MKRMQIALIGLVLALGALALTPGRSAVAARSTQATPTGQRGAAGLAYVASVVGVTPAVLQQDLQAGKTLLQIAGSKYASADDLATALLAPVKTALDKAAGANKLSPTQENTVYTRLHARVATLVVTPHPALGALMGVGHGAKGTKPSTTSGSHLLGGIRGGLLTTLVTTCKTTPAALQVAVHAGGKSPLAICQATNPSVTQASLVAALSGAIKTKLDKAVAAKQLTATQESSTLSGLQSYLNTWVTTPITARGSHH
ncbi:MAG TPA: hypothetical protein VF221_23540 [Chloroflexota bacterium]